MKGNYLKKTSLRKLRPSAAFADAAPIKDSFRACPLFESSSSQSRNRDSPTPQSRNYYAET
ncbi:uncharacterized protein METZ01_LOCUS69366 [marine metagenome]|uniref:Uncharacterized protein n=1 Tax=marine metagenome TaxID=408172 RepID=A0A381TK78_9ZZZZ